MSRPEYVRCALTGMLDQHDKPERKTWCGRTLGGFEWTFEDASHAAINGKSGGRLLLCEQCFDAINAALGAGTYYRD